jgi:hypothetical protein
MELGERRGCYPTRATNEDTNGPDYTEYGVIHLNPDKCHSISFVFNLRCCGIAVVCGLQHRLAIFKIPSAGALHG